MDRACLTPVPAEKLHEVWDWVEAGLREVRAHASWHPADVYMQLRLQTAYLCTVKQAGFLIYQVLPGDDFRGVLHVWCIWGDLKPYEAEIEDGLDALAQEKQTRVIRAIGRKGWGRQGFMSPAGYVFERQVPIRPA